MEGILLQLAKGIPGSRLLQPQFSFEIAHPDNEFRDYKVTLPLILWIMATLRKGFDSFLLVLFYFLSFQLSINAKNHNPLIS